VIRGHQPDFSDIAWIVPQWLATLRAAGYRVHAIADPDARRSAMQNLRMRQIELGA